MRVGEGLLRQSTTAPLDSPEASPSQSRRLRLRCTLCQPVGHRPENPDIMYNSGRDVWSSALRARQPEITAESIEAYLHNLSRTPGLRVQRGAGVRPILPDATPRDAGRHAGAPLSDVRGHYRARAEGPVNGISLARAEGLPREDDRPGARLSTVAPAGDARSLRHLAVSRGDHGDRTNMICSGLQRRVRAS